MPHSIPSVGTINWGNPLNNHLAQLSDPLNGGINTQALDTPTSEDIGHTYLNNNQIYRYNGTAYEKIIIDNSVKIVSSITSLKSINIDEYNDIESLVFLVLGFQSPSDGGGGFFRLDLGITDDENGGTIIESDFNSSWKWERIILDSTISVKWFGAIGDGINDDTIAIQGAINFAQIRGSDNNNQFDKGQRVILPAGRYKITDTLVIDTNGLSLEGVGSIASSIINASTNKDSIYVSHDELLTANKTIIGVDIKNLLFTCTQQNPSQGGHIHFVRAGISMVENCKIYNHYQGVIVEGCAESVRVLNTEFIQGGNTSALQSGSCAIYVPVFSRNNDPNDPNNFHEINGVWYAETNSLILDNLNIRSNNFGMEDCIRVEACDGIYFTNAHVGFALRSCLCIESKTLENNNINISNVFFDPKPGVTDYGVLYIKSGNETPLHCSSQQFNNCIIGGANINAVKFDSDVIPERIFFNNCNFKACRDAGVVLTKCEHIGFKNCTFFQNNLLSSNPFQLGSQPHILIDGTTITVNNIMIQNCHFDRFAQNNIRAEGAVAGLTITGNMFSDFNGNDIEISAQTTNIVVSDNIVV